MPESTLKVSAALLVALAIGAAAARAQVSDEATPAAPSYKESPGEFQFVRLAYAANQYGRGWGGRQIWQTDWPDAEYHIVPDAGHSAMDPGVRRALIRAISSLRIFTSSLLSPPPPYSFGQCGTVQPRCAMRSHQSFWSG